MILALIAAHDPDLVIGYQGGLPWRLPEDLKHFKKRTMGHSVVMGRGVFEELGEKTLPGRQNIVLTSRSYSGVTTFDSVDKALEHLESEEKVYIIGGAQIYRQTINRAHRLEITRIHANYPGDTWFPEYRHQIGKVWKEVFREEHHGFTFVDYERIS